MDYLFDIDISALPWAPCSNGMNVIENCWGHLTRVVYREGRQFHTIDDLREVLIYEWEKLLLSHIRRLIDYMPRRIKQLYKRDGRETEYMLA